MKKILGAVRYSKFLEEHLEHEWPLHWLPGKSAGMAAFSTLFSLCVAYFQPRYAKCGDILSIGSKRLTVDK